jgi:tetratricopeptide (TPR) repeat protein
MAYLLEHPESCEGQSASVCGFMTCPAGQCVLWLSQQDAVAGEVAHSFKVKLTARSSFRSTPVTKENLSEIAYKFVDIGGRLTRSDSVSRGIHAGEIELRSVIPKTALQAANDVFRQADSFDTIGAEAHFWPAMKAYKVAHDEAMNARRSEDIVPASLGLGRSQARLGLHDQAIQSYRVAIAYGPRSSGAHDAYQLIASSQFALGSYEDALQFLQTAQEDHPRMHLCGTCMNQDRMRYRLSVAILKEYLGRYDEAIGAYLEIGGQVIHLHLWELYERAGQLSDFFKMVETVDEYYRRMLEKYDKSSLPLSLPETVRKFQAMRGMAERHEWDGLMKIIDPVKGDWPSELETKEAAELLAAHSEETLPLLLEGMGGSIYSPLAFGRLYALARTEAPEAIEALKKEALRRKNYHELQVY